MQMVVSEIRVLAGRRRVWVGVAVILFLGFLFAVPSWAASNRLSGDEPHYLLTTQSLLADGDLDLSNQMSERAYESYHSDTIRPQARPLADGRSHTPHSIGLSILLMPGVAVGGWIGARVELALLAAIILTGAGVLAERFVPKPGWAAPAATLFCGLSAPLWVYSTQVYPELPAGGLVLVAALIWTADADRRRPMVAAIGQVVLILALAWLGIKYLPLCSAIGGIALWRLRGSPRAVALLLGGAGAGAVATVLFNVGFYGGVTPYSTNVLYADVPTNLVVADNVGGLGRAHRVLALLVDSHFGLVRWAPVWAAAVAGGVVLFCRRGLQQSFRPLGLLVVVQWAAATWLALTMRGYWFPGRQVVAILPLLVPAVAYFMARLPVLGGCFGAVSMFVGAATVWALDTAAIGAARDPFWLPLWGFVEAEGLFPDYRTSSLGTWLGSMVWLGVLGTLIWAVYRRRGGDSGRGTAIWPASDVRGLDQAIGQPRIVVGFPARNEEATVGDVVTRAVDAGGTLGDVEVVVVDDGSTDETALRARDAGAIVLSVAGGSRGLGAAVATILTHAVSQNADVVAFMDADGEYFPEDLPHLAEPILAGRADYVTGNRFAAGMPSGMPWWRCQGNRLGSMLVSAIIGQRVRDAQSGIRILSAAAARRAWIVHDYNYAQVLTIGLVRQGATHAEVPARYRRRRVGRTFVRLPTYVRNVIPAMVRARLGRLPGHVRAQEPAGCRRPAPAWPASEGRRGRAADRPAWPGAR